MLAQSILVEAMPFYAAKLPLCPSVNTSYDIVTIKTKKGKIASTLKATEALETFKEEAAWKLKVQRKLQDWDIIQDIITKKHKRKHVPLRVEIKVHVKSLWRRDLDGFIKATQDAVFHDMGVNDNLITKMDVEKMIADDEEYCTIKVYVRE